MSLPNLKRRPLGQEVTILLRRMIQRGELTPGQRLVEERLAKELGLSRTPVREALHRLEQEGLLAKPPKGGYEVRPLTVKEVEDAIGVRVVLEAYAAGLAAQRADQNTLSRLEKSLSRFQAALEKGDEDRLVELNAQFHDLIYRAADSQILTRILQELHGEVERVSRGAQTNLPAGRWSIGDHQELFEAVKAGDAQRASSISTRHVEHGGRHILSEVKAQAKALAKNKNKEVAP